MDGLDIISVMAPAAVVLVAATGLAMYMQKQASIRSGSRGLLIRHRRYSIHQVYIQLGDRLFRRAYCMTYATFEALESLMRPMGSPVILQASNRGLEMVPTVLSHHLFDLRVLFGILQEGLCTTLSPHSVLDILISLRVFGLWLKRLICRITLILFSWQNMIHNGEWRLSSERNHPLSLIVVLVLLMES
jgi:hypothetical protein